MKTIKLFLVLSCFLCAAIAELEYVNEESENEVEGIEGSGSGSGSGMEEWDEQEKGRDENEESERNGRKKRTNEEENGNEPKSRLSSNLTSSLNLTEETPKKRTELNGQKPKGLTSNTEVSVPAGVIAKVFGGSSNGSASLVSTPDQSTASLSISKDNIHAEDETFSEKRNNLKPKPIGPMETLEVTINGQASTKNNFTKTAQSDSEEIELPQMQKVEGKNIVRKSISKEKRLNKPKISHKKINKKSKRSKVAFPKIILYQGPLSKAIEKMLYSKTSNEKKRSEIEKLFRGEKAKKRIVQENSDDNDESEESEKKEHSSENKKSNVEASKKYKVKGFVDNIEVDSTSKKSKTDDSKEKPSVIQSDKMMREHLNNMMRDSSPYSRSYVAKTSKTVKSNEDKNQKKPKTFTSSNQPPMIHLKDSAKNKDETSGDDDEELEVKNKPDESSGEDEKKAEEEDDDEDGSSEEDDNDEGSANIGMQSHNPDEPKPEPVKEEEPTNPKIKPSNVPVTPNGPSVGNLPPAVQNKPFPVEGSLPLQPKLPQAPQSQQPLPQLSPPNPLPISIPFPPINLPPPPPPPQAPATEENSDDAQNEQSYFQDELMTQVDLNTQGIEALSSRVSELENKEKELENAMGSISEGLERIEKKLDTQQHKQSITSFSEFNPVNAQEEQPNLGNEEISKKPTILINALKKIYEMFSMKSPLRFNGFKQVRRRPKIIKEIFIPLPPKGSIQAQAIENGKLMDSPILNRLPLPIRQLVSSIFKQQLKKEEPTEEPDEPAKEHDLDKLELQLGRIPISRHGAFQRMPKLLVFAKAPRFQDLMAKPCYQPCQNGGHCLGNNVCRCYHGFAGPQCQHRLRPTIVEIIGPSPIQMFKQNRNSHQITLPIAPIVESSVNNDDEDEDGKQKTIGHVDQSKIVNVLRNTLPFKTLTEESENYYDVPFKRYHIPHGYQPAEYQRYNDYYQNGYHRYY